MVTITRRTVVNSIKSLIDTKNLEDAKADYLEQNRFRKKEIHQKWQQEQVDYHRDAVIDMVKQGFWSMAKNRIKLIESIEEEIRKHRSYL